MFGDIALLCYCPVEQPGIYKIHIPNSLLAQFIHWYHLKLGHVGATRLHDTIATHLYYPLLRTRVEEFVATCQDCNRLKLPGRGYGHLPPRNTRLLPWEEVSCDTIGPWTIHLNGRDLSFKALTTIDNVSTLCEIVRVNDGTSIEAGNKFESSWLQRYPRPDRCIHDNGSEFAYGFLRILQLYNIKNVPTTTYNPQSNAVCERMHQTIGNIIRTYVHTHPPQNEQEAAALVDKAIGVAMHAMRITVHRTLKVSPGALVFHRDMLLNIPLVANLLTIRERRQNLIDDNLRRQNAKRRHYDYKVGDWVSKLVIDPTRMDPLTEGRYQIIQVHVNGTVTIRINQNVTERINIR